VNMQNTARLQLIRPNQIQRSIMYIM
jgi:hypothetical protein